MFRPRYSLLALVLFSLFAGSVLVLVKTFPVWRPVAELPKSAKYVVPSFTGQYLMAEDKDFTILYDKDGRELHCFSEDDPPGGAFSPGDVYFYKGLQGTNALTDRVLTLWNLAENKKGAEILLKPKEAVKFSCDSRWVLAQRGNFYPLHDEGCRLIDTRTGKEVYRWGANPLRDEHRYTLGTTGAGSALLVTYSDRIERWDLETLKVLSTIQLGPGYLETGSRIVSNDLEWLGLVPKAAREVRVFNTRTGRLEYEIDVGCMITSTDSARILIDAERGRLAARFNPFAGGVWELKSGEQLSKPLAGYPGLPQTNPGNGFRVSLGGKFYEVFGGGHLGPVTFSLWDRETFEYLNEWTVKSKDLESSPPLAIDTDMNLLEIPTGEVLADLRPYERFYFLPGASRIVASEHSDWRGPQLLGPHRPNEWWGVAWLPAFWSTVVLAISFVWCVFFRKVRSA